MIFLLCVPYIRSLKLTKTPLLTNLALELWNPKALHLWTLMKISVPGSTMIFLSVLTFQRWSLEESCVPPPGPESDKLCFTLSYSLLLNCGSPSIPGGFYITNVNLNKSQQYKKKYYSAL